jgi:hypothetical protein
VTIPDEVISMGDIAFYGCTALTSVAIPGSISNIGTQAFGLCNALTSVNISEGVTSIGTAAFSQCTSLASLTIPSSVDSIGEFAFFNCPSLRSIDFLGLVAPAVGSGWIDLTDPGIRGHAFAASDFPTPGGDFFGLTMGDVIPIVGPPSAPLNLTAKSEVGMVTLNWSEPADDGGSPITGYKVYRQVGSGSPALLNTTAASTLTYVDSTGSAGTNYTYYVVAINSEGDGQSAIPVKASSQAEGENPADNTWLYLGAGLAAMAIIGGSVFFLMRRKK